MRETPLILIADDEANFREVMSMQLKSAGYEVEVASSGDEAIKKTKELLPDLV